MAILDSSSLDVMELDELIFPDMRGALQRRRTGTSRYSRPQRLFPGFDQSDCSLAHEAEQRLISIAMALGAGDVAGWSQAERALARDIVHPAPSQLRKLRGRIRDGSDPLGSAFCMIRTPAIRRQQGATFTPTNIVAAMLAWAASHVTPAQVIDPGTGSGRFLIEASKRFPDARLIGIERDPVPAILARANAAVLGIANRTRIIVADYRDYRPPRVAGPTLYVGNPPYVRHHQIEPAWKKWLMAKAEGLGCRASQLAGLHVHFFLATAAIAKPGDFGSFITSAEWLDVNYGSLVRELFVARLGGLRLDVIEPTAMPFDDAATTAAIASFHVEHKPRSIFVRRVPSPEGLHPLKGGRRLRRERFETERRWSHLTRIGRQPPEGFVELGELCRVHRGTVTGANRVWIAGPHCEDLPEAVLYPSVTRARELFQAGRILQDTSLLRRVIDLPLDLDVFDTQERRIINRFLKNAKRLGADKTYIAVNRRAWWCVGLRKPAPILATYMARRPPAFVRNRADARHINIAHGLYPREPLSDPVMCNLANYLSNATYTRDGRTYAGGLTKFEPREMERLFVPTPKVLEQRPFCTNDAAVKAEA